MLPKEKIKALVSTAKIREALLLFRESLSPNDSVSENDIIQLSFRYMTLEDKESKNLISFDNAGLERAAISNALLNFLNQWNKGDKSPLDKAILALPVDKEADLGKLQLLNCNRERPIKRFNKVFDKQKTNKQAFQFYFIGSCPNEMPSSLAERVLYEIIEEESKELKSSVSYPDYEKEDFRRVLIEELPLSVRGTSASKNLFKEYVQKRFEFSQTESFDTFIETGIPKLKYSHVVSIFRIEESKWKADEGEIVDYFKWMADTFKTSHANVPIFIFLIIIEIENLYNADKVRPRSRTIIPQLEVLCAEKGMTLFNNIEPIEADDLQTWFSSNLRILNPNHYKPVIDAFIQSLETPLEIDGERRFHMKDFEPVQEKVIKIFRK